MTMKGATDGSGFFLSLYLYYMVGVAKGVIRANSNPPVIHYYDETSKKRLIN